MSFPQKLNPLRGTRHAWLFPFTWALLQCAAVTAPITLEVFLHHRFGARTGRNLLKGFLLLLVITPLFDLTFSGARIPLCSGFLWSYSVAAIFHWMRSRFGPPNEQMHSHRNGEPWPLWRRWALSEQNIERYAEPALCCLVAGIISFLDAALARWIVLASVALFIKQQLRASHLRTHRLDALDNRTETTERAPRPRTEHEPFVEARPAPAWRVGQRR